MQGTWQYRQLPSDRVANRNLVDPVVSSESQFLHKKSPSTESQVLLGAVRRTLVKSSPSSARCRQTKTDPNCASVSFPHGHILLALLIYIIHHPSRVVPLLMHT
ncbi:unnamed protein product [Ixodes pacificus]